MRVEPKEVPPKPSRDQLMHEALSDQNYWYTKAGQLAHELENARHQGRLAKARFDAAEKMK